MDDDVTVDTPEGPCFGISGGTKGVSSGGGGGSGGFGGSGSIGGNGT